MELGGLGAEEEEATVPLGFLLSQLREPVRRVSDPSAPELSPGPTLLVPRLRWTPAFLPDPGHSAGSLSRLGQPPWAPLRPYTGPSAVTAIPGAHPP
eukprot:9439015-Alexandrium_andersonii.AAC.1